VRGGEEDAAHVRIRSELPAISSSSCVNGSSIALPRALSKRAVTNPPDSLQPNAAHETS
jgi:hypothetical protein